MKNNIVEGGIYRHNKTGNLYKVLNIAKHSETLEDVVVYMALYSEGKIWVRPLSMWFEKNDESVVRFEKCYSCDEILCNNLFY